MASQNQLLCWMISEYQNHDQERVRRMRTIRSRLRRMRRRQAEMHLCIVLVILQLIINRSGPRRMWMRERNSLWWDRIVLEMFLPSDWIENFRMKHETFLYVCDKLRPAIEHQETRFRKTISIEKRVAITLWCLATPAEYRTVAHLFGIARSTVCDIVHETCLAIVDILLPIYQVSYWR